MALLLLSNTSQPPRLAKIYSALRLIHHAYHLFIPEYYRQSCPSVIVVSELHNLVQGSNTTMLVSGSVNTPATPIPLQPVPPGCLPEATLPPRVDLDAAWSNHIDSCVKEWQIVLTTACLFVA